MDNNDRGEGEYMCQIENQIFPKHINYYLAIMAVSCYQCEYLMILLQEQFLLSGGQLEWLLIGLDAVDPKIKRIAVLNEKLAYRPWSIVAEDISSLIKEGDHCWNLNEVLKAAYILSTYHGLCGLCLGMGLQTDNDIVAMLASLVGPKIELLVSSQALKRANVTVQSKENALSNDEESMISFCLTDQDADVSSVTSRSQRSDKTQN